LFILYLDFLTRNKQQSMSEVEINETIQDQCKNQVVKVYQDEVNEEIPAEKELANCLKVQSDSDSES